MAPFAVFEVEGLSSMFVSNVSFSSCFSARDGGAIQAYGGATLEVFGSKFYNTSSAGCGGAIAAAGGVITISKSTFSGCSAVSGGGAMCAFDFVRYGQEVLIATTLKILNSAFNSCRSIRAAGAIWARSSKKQTAVAVFIENCIFQVSSEHFIRD
jgi:hypothetical protein